MRPDRSHAARAVVAAMNVALRALVALAMFDLTVPLVGSRTYGACFT